MFLGPISDSGRGDASLQERDARISDKETMRDKIESVKQQHDRQKASSRQVHLQKGQVGGGVRCFVLPTWQGGVSGARSLATSLWWAGVN